MATQKEHLGFSPETVWGTYVAPSYSYIIRKGAVHVKQNYEVPEETGSGRAQAGAYQLEKMVEGSIEASLRPDFFGYFIKTVLATVASVAAGTGYRHKFLPLDTAEVGSFSGQITRANGVTQAFRGATPKNFKIMGEAKQVARWSMDIVAKDATVIAPTAVNWADGTTAPAVVDLSTLYPVAPIQEPMKFFQGSILFGGTKALTTGEIVVTGGVAQAGVRRCDLTIDLGTETDDYNILSDPTINSAQAAKRKITATVDIDQKVAADTFLAAHLTGLNQVLVLDFTGPIISATFPWLFRVVLPILKVTDAPQADVDGGQGLKRVTLELTAFADSALAGAPDVGMVLQNKDTSY